MREWVVRFVLLTISWTPLVSLCFGLGANDVVVVINPESPTSIAIGEYYAQVRGIPEDNICYLPEGTPTREGITYEEYKNFIKDPIKYYLLQKGLLFDVKCIVTTKGVPLKIYEDYTQDDNYGDPGTIDRASVDSELTLIRWGGPRGGFISNPYYYRDMPFDEFSPQPYEADFVLVTRLTGYEFDEDGDGIPDDVKRLIDATNTPPEMGVFLFDEDPLQSDLYDIGNVWMSNAASLLEGMGYIVIDDKTPTFISNVDGILGYCSWGSNDRSAPPAPYYSTDVPGRWANRALAVTYVSLNGRTFTYGENGPLYGQSLVADLIHLGASGVQGHVDEPYLESVARPYILFDRYVRGYTLAESFYMAMPWLGWQEVVVGDPLLLFKETVEVPEGILREGWNLIGLPVELSSSDPEVVFADLIKAGNSITGALFRYTAGAGLEIYPNNFTKVDSSHGYWIYVDNPVSFEVPGKVKDKPENFPLVAGWNLLPYPFVEPQWVGRLRFRLSGEEKSFEEAVGLGWVSDRMFYFDGSYKICSIYEENQTLEPWRAYWLVTYVEGLEVVIPTP